MQMESMKAHQSTADHQPAHMVITYFQIFIQNDNEFVEFWYQKWRRSNPIFGTYFFLIWLLPSIKWAYPLTQRALPTTHLRNQRISSWFCFTYHLILFIYLFYLVLKLAATQSRFYVQDLFVYLFDSRAVIPFPESLESAIEVTVY